MAKNRLVEETSPYLLQHADNPVEWWPWGPEALAEATSKNKPILLSIGYAACHWCHVMAHESFENKTIAARMNDLFINIKVDREERPDLDTIYQHALQALGRPGGWPLTMFLTSKGEPFWGGTYFPPQSQNGSPGFPDILNTINEYWSKNQEAISQNVSTLKVSLSQLGASERGPKIDLDTIERAARRLAQEYDTVNGGIGAPPKFPNTSILELLLKTYKRCGREELKNIVVLTLKNMSQGGIFDHLGGGYARYSTDAIWLVPHFEKMLYDNAQILDLLTWIWQETKDPLFQNRAKETAAWVLREMITPQGGFAATLDADSEGQEGKFYVWEKSQITRILGLEAPLFMEAYDVLEAGNWEGKNILNRTKNDRVYSSKEEQILGQCRKRLLLEREKRIRPGWDDKVLADWNGLMISALAHASAVFNEPSWLAAAESAFKFVNNVMNEKGTLYHAYRDGRVNHAATLDDYACMIRAGLTLYEITGAENFILAAEQWTTTAFAQFWDKEGEGYFYTAEASEALIVRTKSASDSATPSSNGVMVANLSRLYFLTGNSEYRVRADQVITAFSGELAKNFFPYATLMNSAEFLQCAVQISIVAFRSDPGCQTLLDAVYQTNIVNKVISVISPDSEFPKNHPAFGKKQKDNLATAFICIGETCSLPITDADSFSARLASLV